MTACIQWRACHAVRVLLCLSCCACLDVLVLLCVSYCVCRVCVMCMCLLMSRLGVLSSRVLCLVVSCFLYVHVCRFYTQLRAACAPLWSLHIIGDIFYVGSSGVYHAPTTHRSSVYTGTVYSRLCRASFLLLVLNIKKSQITGAVGL